MYLEKLMRAGLVVALLALAACARDGAGAASQPPTASASAAAPRKVATGAEAKGPDAYFPLSVGGKSLRVQVVVTEPEMQRGLMGRRDLGPDDGMVFVYLVPRRMNFWMKNTPTPLDIGFFMEDGTLGEVHALHPFDETSVSSAGADYTLALEVNQGWFAKHGVKPGAKIDFVALAAALRARGFPPGRYGVPEE